MAKSSPPTQAQSLRRHLEETSRDLAAAQAGFDQTCGLGTSWSTISMRSAPCGPSTPICCGR